ncbi:MAG: hypothetical protein IKR93_02655 [Firmicutes bacterium]|jgi:hypothetical protein|nr:hypothetical protein [Bacillota bacterium]
MKLRRLFAALAAFLLSAVPAFADVAPIEPVPPAGEGSFLLIAVIAVAVIIIAVILVRKAIKNKRNK